MYQYLINTSITWLSCYILFKVLLQRESFHQGNRFYLLASLLAGVLIPFLDLHASTPFLPPATTVYEMKKAIQVDTYRELPKAVATSSFPLHSILWYTWLMGMVVVLIWYLNEARMLYMFFKRGQRRSEQGYCIVETGRTHSPFSFFNIIFVENRVAFSNTQWQFLLQHEKEHAKQLHSIDNLFILLLRIVFWFHPLPYLYFRQVRLIHEYQADAAAGKKTGDYGHFLIEQNFLQRVPLLVHSINHSPIKTRIFMLTKKRSAASHRLKYLALLPLVAALILLCSKSTFSLGGESYPKQVLFKGNRVGFAEVKVIPFEYMETMRKQKAMFLYADLPDSIPMKNWATGAIVMEKVKKDVIPVTLNGQPVYGNEDQYAHNTREGALKMPAIKDAVHIDEYLYRHMKQTLERLPDGAYSIRVNRLVVDAEGTIAYFEDPHIELARIPRNEKMPDADGLRRELSQQMKMLLEKKIRFSPAMLDGVPVPARLQAGQYEINVKDHKSALVERAGC